MSKTVTERGKIKLILTPDGLTKFEKAKWMVENLGASFEDFCEDSQDVFDDSYLYLNGQWFYVQDRAEPDTGDFCEVVQLDTDTYTFFCQYYNGATCLEEVLQEGLDKLN